MAKQLPASTRRLIKTAFLYVLAGTSSGVFVDIFIWKQTVSFATLVVFNLALFCALLVIYLASGHWLRHYSARTLVKLGFAALTTFYLTIVLLRERAVGYLVPLGMLRGIGEGLFWSGFNVHQYVQTIRNDRDYYFGVSAFWVNLAAVVGPLLGGAVIVWGNRLPGSAWLGYYLLFFTSAALFLIAFWGVRGYPRLSSIAFRVSDIQDSITRNPNFRLVLGQQVFIGLRDVSMMTLTTIIAFTILMGEFNLGLYKSAIGLGAAITGYAAGKLLVSANRKSWTLFSALALATGSIALAIRQNPATLALFALASILGAFLDISLGTFYFASIDEDTRPWQAKYAYLINRDGVLGIARVVSYLLLWGLFAVWEPAGVVRTWLAIAGSLSIPIWFLLTRMRLQKLRPLV